MTTYILRRLLLMIPTLLGVTAVVFFVMALSPGGFGGTLLNQEGGLTEGEEARRIRRYFMRRYGLDKPAVVQFGRWLNQVSPVGFKTSSQILFDDDQIRVVRLAFEQLPSAGHPWPDRLIDKAVDVALSLAAYCDTAPEEAASWVTPALTNPRHVAVLFEKLDQSPDQELITDAASQFEDDPYGAAYTLLNRIALEAAGRNRVLFNRPALKWPDLGTSLRGRPVTELLKEAVPITFLLNAVTIPIIYAVSIISGIYAARHRGKLFDVFSGTTYLALWSIPTIWAGVMLIGYLANKEHLKLFPTAGLHDLQADAMAFLPRWGERGFERGWLLDMCWHLVLPIFCLTYGGFAVLSKLARGAILENLTADFVRTARAKGVSEHDVLFRHVLRNSLLPLITVAAAILPALLTGSVIVENIFSISGMGKLGVDAAFMKDREVVMGTTLIAGGIGLLSELARDVCYAIADPRVSYE